MYKWRYQLCVHIDNLFILSTSLLPNDNSFNVHNIWDHTNLCILVNRASSISHKIFIFITGINNEDVGMAGLQNSQTTFDKQILIKSFTFMSPGK
jgi:hypothetical protein